MLISMLMSFCFASEATGIVEKVGSIEGLYNRGVDGELGVCQYVVPTEGIVPKNFESALNQISTIDGLVDAHTGEKIEPGDLFRLTAEIYASLEELKPIVYMSHCKIKLRFVDWPIFNPEKYAGIKVEIV